MKAALYLRVSTVDRGQDVKVQEGPLTEWVTRLGYDPVVYAEEGVSGAKTTRPVLDRLLRAVRRREVQAVAVWKLDRLGRSLQHLLLLLAEFEANDVRLLVHDMAADTATPHGRLFFQLAGAFAEFERSMIAERTKDGMTYAMAHGTKSGRPVGRPAAVIDFRTILDGDFQRAHGHPQAQADALGIGKATLDRLMKAEGYRWVRDVGWVNDAGEPSETLPPKEAVPA